MSELLWVAVPNGFVPKPNPSPPPSLLPPTQALIRVLIVPRLDAGQLSDFGLDNWPQTLSEASIFIRTRAGEQGTITTHLPQSVSSARSDVWDAFFSGDAKYINNPYQPRTNPVPNVSQTYRHAADAHLTHRNVTREVATPTTNPVNPDAVIRTHLLATWAAFPEPTPPPTDTTPPALTPPDFPSTVSTLREHPRVLLDLGLIFELTVDVGILNLGAAGADWQLCVGNDDMPAPFLVSPWTRYNLDIPKNVFRPAPASGSNAGISNGTLDLTNSMDITELTAPLDPTRWALATFDIDGIVGNLAQTARDLRDNPQVPATLPPMRSVGLVLLRPNRQGDFAERTRAAAANAARSMTGAVLSAEDLVLGYRVDIKHSDNVWRSVCERDAMYKVAAIGGPPVVIGTPPGSTDGHVCEEGHVKAFIAVKDADGALHSDEVVLRWGGWSLALPTPNLRGDTSGPARNPSQLMPYQFEWDFQIPRNRLPALRFSNKYRMRIRIADIAGGGVALEDPLTDQGSATVVYRRHDPILAPYIRAAGEFAPGAAIDRLVIRSDRDMTPEQLHALDPDYPLTETRVLDPPTASLQLIEQHGIFDGQGDLASFQLAQRAMRADASGSGLPDPIAQAVNAVVPAISQSFQDPWVPALTDPAWPDRASKRIDLVAPTAGSDPIIIEWVDKPAAGLPTRTLEVTLAKGKQATIELSSTIVDEKIADLAVTNHLGLSDPAINDADTLNGLNPVVTPPRKILVVHAVKRPLADPLWDLPPTAIQRDPGSRSAVLNATFTEVNTGQGLNTGSTGRLDVAASWTEFEDVALQADPGQRHVAVAHLDSQPIPLSDPPPTLGQKTPLQIRHEFGDTKHRRITYTLNATSRFREYFKSTEPEDSFHATLNQPEVNILSTARPPAPIVLCVVPAFGWQRIQFGAERIEHTRSAQRLRVELARPWFATGEGEQLAVVLAPSDSGAAAAGDLVTRIGRDPLFATPATPPRPQLEWFPNGAAATTVTLPELNAPVTVIPFDVIASGDRWYADIQLSVPTGAQSYNPFVQLAVARYQRDSLDSPDGLQMSTVVITERVPLLPDRHVVVTRVGDQLNITVDGTSPNPLNRFEAILETCDPGIAPESVDLVVDDPATEPQIPAWRPIPGRSVVRTDTGTVPPLTLAPTPGRLRVRLRETENLDGTDTTPPDLVRRNIFVDTIILPTAWQPT